VLCVHNQEEIVERLFLQCDLARECWALIGLAVSNFPNPYQIFEVLGFDLPPLGPTAFWALFSRLDRGRPTLHGWWAPVTLRYI
jgi:hypothetical protein